MYSKKTTLEILRIWEREKGLLCINNWKQRAVCVCVRVCVCERERDSVDIEGKLSHEQIVKCTYGSMRMNSAL